MNELDQMLGYNDNNNNNIYSYIAHPLSCSREQLPGGSANNNSLQTFTQQSSVHLFLRHDVC